MEETTKDMIVRVADNIISPLGFSSAENYQAVKSGESALRYYENHFDIPEPFTASLFNAGSVNVEFDKLQTTTKYTIFEKVLILSISKALSQTTIDPTSNDVQIILSTTKGNVSLLDDKKEDFEEDRVLLGTSAKIIANHFGNPNPPIVISNACISGVCAQIAAMRYLNSSRCNTVIVAGADIQSRFTISGFQSLKALSPTTCRPFDARRNGLNLGEAAATLIYRRKNASEIVDDDWIACRDAIRNDANHISTPSRTGEGCYRALHAILQDKDIEQLAFVNSHGTATLYNDEMEAVAITRAGLSTIPVNSLKGYYGHTMGAAGLLETIISMYAVNDGVILGTRGYETCGTSRPLILTQEHTKTDKQAFVKLLSGFGGCNATLLFKKGGLL